MTKNSLYALLLIMSASLTSCEVIGDIFQAGMWFGVIIVIAVVLLVVWILRKISR